MELWIRSQNKESLKKVDTIEIYEQDNGCCRINDFGLYETKERALEVLDEIQIRLMPKKFLNSQGIINPTYEILQEMPIYIYEMPEE